MVAAVVVAGVGPAAAASRIAQQTRGLPTRPQNGRRRSCWDRAKANLTASTRRHRVPWRCRGRTEAYGPSLPCLRFRAVGGPESVAAARGWQRNPDGAGGLQPRTCYSAAERLGGSRRRPRGRGGQVPVPRSSVGGRRVSCARCWVARSPGTRCAARGARCVVWWCLGARSSWYVGKRAAGVVLCTGWKEAAHSGSDGYLMAAGGIARDQVATAPGPRLAQAAWRRRRRQSTSHPGGRRGLGESGERAGMLGSSPGRPLRSGAQLRFAHKMPSARSESVGGRGLRVRGLGGPRAGGSTGWSAGRRGTRH